MPLAHQAGQRVLKHHLRTQARGNRIKMTPGNIDFAVGQCVHRYHPFGGFNDDPHLGCYLLKALHERGQNHQFKGVVSGNTKGFLGAGRVKVGWFLQRALNVLKDQAQRVDQLRCACGERVAARATHQQGVAQPLPQLAHRGAHGGLTHVQPLRRTGYAALVQQCVQHHQQVQVLARYIQHLDVMYLLYLFYK
jgi:hypothetical protein